MGHDLRAFQHGSFSISVIVMSLAMMALFGTIIILPLILQRALHLDPLTVGLMLLPGGLLMGLLGPVTGRLFDRVGPRPLMLPASVVIAGVFWLLSTIQLSTPWWLVVAAHMAMSASFAFMFTPLFTIALGSLPKDLYSHGSAVVGTVQQVAGAFGTAVFVTAMASQSAAAQALPPLSQAAAGAAAALLVPPLKSVAYQPVPLSWKPGAVNCLEKAAAPQAGQSVNGASDIFWSTSLAWPQAPHLYA